MIIAFTGTRPLGQHFLDWSFRYLTGSKNFWHWEKGMVDLVSEPVSDQPNAHQHTMNHMTVDQCEDFIEKASSRQRDYGDLITFWPVVGGSYTEDFFSNFSQMIDKFSDSGIRSVIIKKTNPYPYYVDRTGKSEKDIIEETRQKFRMEQYDIAKIRETLSFNITKALTDPDSLFDQHKKKVRTLIVTDQEWVYHPEDCIKEICEFTENKIITDKIPKWRTVREKWLINYEKVIRFYQEDLPQIVEAIISDRSLDLVDKDIGLINQSVIMAHLMKDHGRRLLLPSDEFPKNTKDLHRFLK